MGNQKPFYTFLIDKKLMLMAIDPDAYYESKFDSACRRATREMGKLKPLLPEHVTIGWIFQREDNIIDFYLTVRT